MGQEFQLEFDHDVICDAENEDQIGVVSKPGNEKIDDSLSESCQITVDSIDDALSVQTSAVPHYPGVDNDITGIGGLRFLEDVLRAEIKKKIDRLPDNRLSAVFSLIENAEDIPEDALPELFALVKEFAEEAKRGPIPELPEKPSEDQLYQLGDDLLEHLEKTWGKYLTHYNSDLDEDILYRDYLWEHDPVFMRKLYDRLRYLHASNPSNNPAPEKIIKRRTDRVSEKVDTVTPEEAKEYKRISSAVERRKRKQSFHSPDPI